MASTSVIEIGDGPAEELRSPPESMSSSVQPAATAQVPTGDEIAGITDGQRAPLGKLRGAKREAKYVVHNGALCLEKAPGADLLESYGVYFDGIIDTEGHVAGRCMLHKDNGD